MFKPSLPYILLILFSFTSQAQTESTVSSDTPYTSYFTGNSEDFDVKPSFGVTMMGGRSEHNQAMKWFLRKANGGDILVLRASGSDGYNNYLFSELGVEVNSVESLVVDNAEAAKHPYVIDKIERAEAIWMAGGNQWNYVGIWGNSPMKKALNDHIKVKKGVIGGTSAGMAVLGEWNFSAENGSINSTEALTDPYHERLKLNNDFLKIDILKSTITDTHYADRDRQGRHSAFMARIAEKKNGRVFGIACDEYTAVCIDGSGIAQLFGKAPVKSNAIYFIQTNCASDSSPEQLTENKPLTWNRNGQALLVYKVIVNEGRIETFDLNNWTQGTGGEWKYWYIDNGQWYETNGEQPQCN